MTIDERLDALAMNAELAEARIARLEQVMTSLAEAQVKTEEAQTKTERSMLRLQDTMNRLANIAISHDERLERLEGE